MSGARRALPLLLGALLALLALAAPATAAPSPAVAATATPTPAPSPASTLPVRVQILEVNPTVLRPGEDLTVRVRLTNRSGEEIAAPRARVHLERIRPGTRADLQRWLAEPTEPNRRGRVGAPVADARADEPLAAGASVELTATVPADAVGLLDRPDTWGARGLAVEVLDTRGVRAGIQRSFVLWATDGDVAQARLSVLAPVVGSAPVPPGADATSPGPSLSELVRPGARLGTVLELARRTPDVALAVDPALVDTARTADGDVATWVDELLAASVGRDVVGLPWSDPDLAALAHADAPALLDVATAASAEAAEREVEQGTPLAARTDVLWAPGPVTDQDTLDLVAASGASTVVLGPDDLPTDADAAGARTVVPVTGGTLTALVPDATLTDLLVSPEDLDPDATRATVVQRVLAEMSVLARGSTDGPAHVLVVLPRDVTPDVTRVEDVLSAVQASPWSRTAPLTALLGSADVGVDRAAAPASVTAPDELTPEQVRRLVDAREAAIAFADVTDDPSRLLSGVDAAVLAPVATAWRAAPEDRQRVVDEVVDDVDARRVGLTLAQTSARNIISATSEVRFSVRNDLPAAASVQVVTTPRKACLRTEPSPTVVVPADGEQFVPVQVHAIANCEVVVEAVLTSAAGEPLADPVTFVVRASPTIESVGTAVVGALLAVGLVLGVVRTVRRGQSARRGARRLEGDEGTRPLPVLGGHPDGDA